MHTRLVRLSLQAVLAIAVNVGAAASVPAGDVGDKPGERDQTAAAALKALRKACATEDALRAIRISGYGSQAVKWQ